MRLDKALVARGLLATRAKAQDAIAKGNVYVNECLIMKNSHEVEEHDSIRINVPSLRFVSRAGYKLYDVLAPFDITLKERIVIDVGASTGGFSDVCLQQGAKRVYAVDVGSGQLDPSLLTDHRLCNMEHINARYLQRDMFDLPLDFACVDVSFISLTLILPALLAVMDQVEIVALIKPQFEAGKRYVHKNGIVRDPKVHVRVLRELHDFILSLGCYVHHLRKSSIVGRDGNQEYVCHIKRTPCTRAFDFMGIYRETIDQR